MGGICAHGAPKEEEIIQDASSHGKTQNKKKYSRMTNDEFIEEEFPAHDNSSRASTSREVENSTGLIEKESLDHDNSSKLKQNKSKVSEHGATSKDFEAQNQKGKSRSTKLSKAKNALTKISTSMANFGPSTSFSPMHKNEDKLDILCFEVANTIFKGSKLLDSLSVEKVRECKLKVFKSEGVQKLISNDKNELLRLVAYDKRQELKVFSDEIVRFGNRCKNPQFHNLDRLFAKFESEQVPYDGLEEIAREKNKSLLKLARRTSDLYHELHLLTKFEQKHGKKCEDEERSIVFKIGDTSRDFKRYIDNQKSCIKDLRKKTLWFRNLDEVVEKCIDIVHFAHLEIRRAFKTQGADNCMKKSIRNLETLGSTGLALRYANIITKMDYVVLSYKSLSYTVKEALYESLTPNIKRALKTKLRSIQINEEVFLQDTTNKIKQEMEKTLRWLHPMATNTIKTQREFGWVGEMSMRTEEDENSSERKFIPLQTLEHANKERTEQVILDTLVLLHRLVKCSNSREPRLNRTRS